MAAVARPPVAPPVSEVVLWFAVAVPPVAWTARLLIAYPLSPRVCEASATPVWVATAAAAALTLAAGLAGAWAWRRLTAPPAGAGEPGEPAAFRPWGRARFMAVSGILLSGIFLYSIVAEALPLLLQDPCIIPAQDPPRAGLAAPRTAGLLGPSMAHAAHPAGGTGAGEPDTDRLAALVVAVPLVLAALAFAVGAARLCRRLGTGRGVGMGRTSAFAGGLAAAGIALLSPLDALAAQLLSAHMVQHLLLILVAAPLLALARPTVPLLWALPRPARRGLGRWWRRGGGRAAWAALTRPAAAWLLHVGTVWLWHAPALYQAALGDPVLHLAEHAAFGATALLFWWVVVRAGAGGGMGEGLAVLYLFAAMMQMSVFGAVMTFAGTPWYPAYATSAPVWGLSGLEDQQLAGVIMWAPAGLAYVVAAAVLFARWLQAAERRARSRPPSVETLPS